MSSWHEWCGKLVGVDPRMGGCPCPKTEAEWAARALEVQARHRDSVAKAAGPSVTLTHGVWLTTSLWSLVHFFAPGSLASVCEKTSRRARGVQPERPGERRCPTCEQATKRTGGRP